MNEKVPFRQALREWADYRERSLREHPGLAELLRYHDRDLAGSELEDIRNHIAECRICSRTLLEFSQTEAENRESPSMTPDDLNASWRRIQSRIAKGEAEAPPQEKPRPDAPPRGASPSKEIAPSRKLKRRKEAPGSTFFKRLRLHPTALILAASSLLLFGWAIYLKLENARLSAPQVIGGVDEFRLERGGTRGGEPVAFRIQALGDRARLLVLGYQGEQSFPEYMIEIFNPASATTIWRSPSLPQPQFGDFYVVLPPGALERGLYALRLQGLEDGQWALISENELRVD